jgi:hypothetical protein
MAFNLESARLCDKSDVERLIQGVRLNFQARMELVVSTFLCCASWQFGQIFDAVVRLTMVLHVRTSSASHGRPNHPLLNTLHALQVLEALLMKHVDIKLFHDLNNNVQRFEESIHSDAQHAVRRSLVIGPEHSLLFNVSSIFASRVDE